jgi:hypothetical protein
MLTPEAQPLPADRLRHLARLLGAPYTALRDASLRDAGYFSGDDQVRAGATIHLVSVPTLDGVSPIEAFTDADEARRYAALLDRVDGGRHEVDALGLDAAEWPEPVSYVEAIWSNRTARIQTRSYIGRRLPVSLGELRISYATDADAGVEDAIYLVTTTDTAEAAAVERVEQFLRAAPANGPGALAAGGFHALAGTPAEGLEYSVAYAKASYRTPGDGTTAHIEGVGEDSPVGESTHVLPPSVSAALRVHARNASADSVPGRLAGSAIKRRMVVVRAPSTGT